MPQPGHRSYVAGNFGLEFDSKGNAGWLASFEGGMPTSDVIAEKVGPDHLVHKHIGGVKYEDITLSFGTGMSREFWTWLEASLVKRDYVRKSGAVVASNFDLRETSRIDFYNAVVAELGFPALDASSKDAARVTCRITPEYTRVKVTPRGGSTVGGSQDRSKQRKWHRSDFRYRDDNLNPEDCARVSQIEAITIKQTVQPFKVGELRDYQVEPTLIEYPNLVLTVPESHSETFWKWYDDFVVKGKCSQDQEHTAMIEYLTPNLKDVLLTLNFQGLGVFKMTPDKADSASEKIRSVKVECYCEKIDFQYNAAAVWA